MRPSVKLGMALLLGSESVFFLMLILAFVIFRGQSIKVARETLDFPLTSIYTISLFGSSIGIWRATGILKKHDSEIARPWFAIAIALGGVFIVGQNIEYFRLLRHGVTIDRDLFGATFFTLTGMHGLHALIGTALLAGVLWGVGPGRPPVAQRAEAIQAISAFWHFVVGLWVVIFSVVYFWTFV
jgi:heme/copper-type cytochrome/quinol oxidase subunit 3